MFSKSRTIAMIIAQEFIKKLQDAMGNEALPKKFWKDYDSHFVSVQRSTLCSMVTGT